MGGYQLVTTAALYDESALEHLVEQFPLLGTPGIRKELDEGLLKFARKDRREIERSAEELRVQGQSLVTSHCSQQKIKFRRLSDVDASAWAVAMHVNGALATDEWPLRHAASLVGNDDGQTVPLFSSVSLLKLLEEDGLLQPEERWNTFRSWRVEGVSLHRDADEEYWKLFGEAPPNAQSKPRQA